MRYHALHFFGAREKTDLTEFWNWLQNGFQFGDARLTPTNLITFVVIFVLGYMITKLIQRGLKDSILPNTRLDAGGKNAVLAVTSYFGIFVVAMIAITAAGIDLSGLAIVAGALSVGIGFGLQAIVFQFCFWNYFINRKAHKAGRLGRRWWLFRLRALD